MKIGFFTAITLILLILKLTETITCSWFIVFLPLLAPILAFSILLLFMGFVICVASVVESFRRY